MYNIIKKTRSKVFCLNMLLWSMLGREDIMVLLCSKIQLVLLNAAPLWHTCLSEEQTHPLDDNQVPHMDLDTIEKEFDNPYREDWRVTLCNSVIEKSQYSSDKLLCMLSPKKTNLRNTRHVDQFPLPKPRTNLI